MVPDRQGQGGVGSVAPGAWLVARDDDGVPAGPGMSVSSVSVTDRFRAQRGR